MSLLFCIWADQDEERPESEESKSDDEEGTNGCAEEGADDSKAESDNDENEETACATLPSTEDDKEMEEPQPLQRKKPFIGPKSVMKRYRELEEKRKQEESQRTQSVSIMGNQSDQYFPPPEQDDASESTEQSTESSSNANSSNISEDLNENVPSETLSESYIKSTNTITSLDAHGGVTVQRKSSRIRKCDVTKTSVVQSCEFSEDSFTSRLSSRARAQYTRPKKKKTSQDKKVEGSKTKQNDLQKSKSQVINNAEDGDSYWHSTDTDTAKSKPAIPARRELLKRKARPHTFSHIYDMDPFSPFLYTSERRKGPGVSLEFDKDEDCQDENQLRREESSNRNEFHQPNVKRIKVEPRSRSCSPSPHASSSRTESAQAEPFNYGISLESVFSLAEDSSVDKNAAQAVLIKQEPIDEWCNAQYEGHIESDPLCDPLAVKPISDSLIHTLAWPKLDPLFLTVIEFKLPKEYDPYIKALAKPTAEILPIPKENNVVRNVNISEQYSGLLNNASISITHNSVPVTAKIKAEQTLSNMAEVSGVRRSVRKRTGKIDLKNLLHEPSRLKGKKSDTAMLPVSRVPPQKNLLSETLSRIKSSGITITQVKEKESENSTSPQDTSCSSNDSTSKIDKKSSSVNCLKLTNVPWLPVHWKASMSTVKSVEGRRNTTLTFVSPEGKIFHNRQAVVDFLRETSCTKEQQTAGEITEIETETLALEEENVSKQLVANECQLEKNSHMSQECLPRRTVKRANTKFKSIPRRSGRRAVNSEVTKSKPGVYRTQEKYETLCKPGKFTCPICYTVFRLNQTYGRHVVLKECKIIVNPNSPRIISLNKAPWVLDTEDPTIEDEDLQVVVENVRKPALYYVSVIKSTTDEDSYVDCSRVPSLVLLSRGAIPDGGLLPRPISVKEGLQYYHSLVWKENNENSFFERLCELSKISISLNVKSFEKICKEPLKVALYLERKIRSCRENKGPKAQRTRDWVQKYEKFLQLPLHDLFLSLVLKHKVIEYFDKEIVCVLCLNCPAISCNGCAVIQSNSSKPGDKKKIRVPVRVKNHAIKDRMGSMKHSSRCGVCKGCIKPNCQKCMHCLDMVKYGGQGLLKQICLRRNCLTITRPTPSTVRVEQNSENENRILKNCKIAQQSLSQSDKNKRPAKCKPATSRKKRILSSSSTAAELKTHTCAVCHKIFPTKLEMRTHRSETHELDGAGRRKSKRSRKTIAITGTEDAFETDLKMAVSQSKQE